MTPRELNVFQGMVACYRNCRANFEETVRMVGRARGLSSNEVKDMLTIMKEKSGDTPEYKKLRNKLPKEFPM